MSDTERREFLAAAENMARFSSDNVERLEGIVTTQLPYMIVTELPSNGSLLDFIRVRFIIIIIFVVVVVVIIIISCSLSSFHHHHHHHHHHHLLRLLLLLYHVITTGVLKLNTCQFLLNTQLVDYFI